MMEITVFAQRTIYKGAFVILLAASISGFGCAGGLTSRRDLPRGGNVAQVQRQETGRNAVTASNAIADSLSAAEKSLAAATNEQASSTERERALIAYNDAVARLVLGLQKSAVFTGKQIIIPAAKGTYKVTIAEGEGFVDPAKFQRFLIASEIPRKHLKHDVRRDGLGGQMVGVIQPAPGQAQHCPPQGWAEPVTAVAEFSRPSPAGETKVVLSFLDPQVKDHVTVDHKRFPLAGDFTAPLAYYPRLNEMLFGFAAMLRSDKSASRSGIYFYEPYNPEKIPVIFVHGLMSSPHAWIPFINELNSDPEFRRKYQAWVYFYPSGMPIAANAIRLRHALADISTRYPLKKNIVLVGHSMGGIISKMQVTNTGDKLWNGIFGKSAGLLNAQFPPDSLIKQALIFQANPKITRVIFISTPHLGSRLATLRISNICGSIIRMPSAALHGFKPEYRSVLRGIEPSMRSVPNSIVGLSPKSPLLINLHKLAPAVPYHSIIGNQGKNDGALRDSSDGIVPYWSSHLPGAESEIIVPTGHDAFDHPHSVAEVLRILEM
ncbi:MAG: esterase/lipase family protein [Terrimicrobiaceae bacterium]